MKRKMSFVESAMSHWRIILLLTITLGLFGIYSLVKMPRQEFPVFTIREGLIIGLYPGASSMEVEQQLTNAVEKYLFGFKEINKKKTHSVSKEGMMIIYVSLNDDIKNSDEFWSKLDRGLNLLKLQLPTGVAALFTNSDFGDTSAILVALESEQKSYRELETYLNQLEDRLRKIESVSKIRHYGLQKEEINVYLEPEKLNHYGINSPIILANLFTQGFTTSSGSVETMKGTTPIHISKVYASEKDIAEQIIYSDPMGNIIRLQDIARVVREYPEPDNYITYNGKKCLIISMEMQNGNNIVEYGREVNAVLAAFQKELPSGVSISRIVDQPEVVRASISSFLRDFFFAIAAVILVTVVLLPLRVASVAAASIPLTIFASLGIMYITGIELNTVTLAGLVVVLGMIVDNSVVIVDSYMEKLDHGMSRWHAAISSAKLFSRAIFSATLAISITFFPFLFTLKGKFLDFVRLFPWTVTIALGISLLIAMMVIPYFQYYFIKKGFNQAGDKKAKKRQNTLRFIQLTYEKWLDKAFKHPGLTLGIGITSVVIGAFLLTRLPQRLMPVAERNQFAVEIYLPQGSSIPQTAEVADSMEAILKRDERVKSVTSFIGTSSPRFHTTYAPKVPEKNYAQFIVNTASTHAAEDLLDEYSDKYAHYFTNAYVRFKQLDYQPVTAPLEVRISGNNLMDIKRAADTVSKKIRNIKSVCWVHTNFEEMLPGIEVNIDPVEANRFGITKTTVATNLAMHFDGLPITTLWEGDYPVKVRLKTETDRDTSCMNIEKEYIHSVIPGISVPLRQVATISPDWTQGKYVHENGVRTITIMADVTRGTNVNAVFPSVKKVTEETSLPAGLSVEYGGAYESDQETLPQIIAGLILSIIIIFLILLFHFRKINLAIMVLASSSLTLLGATLGGLILKIDFGITSILGIVSLIGILVRNGIIMLDYAEYLRVEIRMPVKEAAIEAGKRRMRPIFLTSAAASVGVIPMIISGSALWAPMGTVICFGTLVSMVILVLFLPVVYWMSFRSSDLKIIRPTLKKFGKKLFLTVLLPIFLMAGTSMSTFAQNRYSLDSCKSLALANNISFKNASLEVEAAKQVKKAAFTRYFPSIEATGLGMKANKAMFSIDVPKGNLPVWDGINPALLMSPTQVAYFPGFSMSFLDEGIAGMATAVQPIFAGGRIFNGNRLASVGVQASMSQMKLTRDEVLLKTEEQYWQVVSLNQKKGTLDLVINLLDTLYKQASDAYEAGLINRNDIFKITMKQNALKVNKLQLDNGIRLATMALCQTIGIEYDSSLVLVDTIDSPLPPQSIIAKAEEAVNSREEYNLLHLSMKAEEIKTRMKMGEYLPEVAIGVGGYYDDLLGDKITNGLVFATVKIPVSGWWEASHSLKERAIREDIARNTSRDKTELMKLQIQKAWSDLEEAYKQIDVANESIKQAEENLKLNSDNYYAGMVNISDMIEAQSLLHQAMNQLTDALVSYRMKWVYYLHVTGRYQGCEEESGTID